MKTTTSVRISLFTTLVYDFILHTGDIRGCLVHLVSRVLGVHGVVFDANVVHLQIEWTGQLGDSDAKACHPGKHIVKLLVLHTAFRAEHKLRKRYLQKVVELL